MGLVPELPWSLEHPSFFLCFQNQVVFFSLLLLLLPPFLLQQPFIYFCGWGWVVVVVVMVGCGESMDPLEPKVTTKAKTVEL